MKRIVIHTTDLFKPHNDPDDHYDVATQFALNKLNKIELKSIIIDNPPKKEWNADLSAIKELNYLTKNEIDCFAINDLEEFCYYLKNLLEAYKHKVDIHICGSCKFIAYFGTHCPSFIRKKVHAIYLNAGSAANTTTLEYNVALDKKSYSTIFTLPCKIYWLPCFDNVDKMWNIGKNGTYFSFLQKDVISMCKDELKNYFISAINNTSNDNFIELLNAKISGDTINKIYEENRNIYCLPGFLHCAHLNVSSRGKIISSISFRKKSFKFIPIKIVSNNEGSIEWKKCINPFARHRIFTITDTSKYQNVMTSAQRDILSKI